MIIKNSSPKLISMLLSFRRVLMNVENQYYKWLFKKISSKTIRKCEMNVYKR